MHPRFDHSQVSIPPDEAQVCKLGHALLLGLLAVTVQAHAGLFDDLAQLKGKTVLYAGDFEQVMCPISGKYDCLTWPMNMLKATSAMPEVCFATSAMACSFSCRGLIVTDASRRLEVFIIEGIGGNMKRGTFDAYKCPSLY